MATSPSHVVVVGAGVSGLSIARELAPVMDVTVIDQGGIAGDTTSRASGVISLALEPVDPEVQRFALETFRDLDGTGAFTFSQRRTIRLEPTGDVVDPPPGGTHMHIERVSEEFPNLFDDLSAYSGAWVYHDTGMLDPVDYAMTLKWLAEADGARILHDRAMTDILIDGDAVTGIETPHGRIDADVVVIATGWRARGHLIEHVELPIRPLRWNAVTFRGQPSLATSLPLGSEPRTRTYWRPLPTGDVLIGGNEHLIEHPMDTPSKVSSAFRNTARSVCETLFAEVDPTTIIREDCCPTADSATPDGLPIIDAPTEAPDGLVTATGFHGRGVMLSPITGRLVRDIVTDAVAPFSRTPFAVDRFDDRSQAFSYRSHWS